MPDYARQIVLQCVAACCSVLQYVAVCCSVYARQMYTRLHSCVALGTASAYMVPHRHNTTFPTDVCTTARAYIVSHTAAYTCDTYGVATVSRIDQIMVSFAEYCLFYRAVLQKRPMI